MRSAGLGLTKLTYTSLEDNLIRHRGALTYYGSQQYDTAQRSAAPLGGVQLYAACGVCLRV